LETGYWFTSSLFEIEPNEDNETNPGYYGKSLAQWLSAEFKKLGYETDVIPEDWGWCVMCESCEYMLWLGCGSMQTEEHLGNTAKSIVPKSTDVIWNVFPVVEVPFFNLRATLKNWFGKLDTTTPFQKLVEELEQVLCSASDITFCEEP
jgi:hypothetical protein